VFHDVDGSGSILAVDFSEVKKRFFDSLPVGNDAAGIVTADAAGDSLFGPNRIRAAEEVLA
jgi:hypothetical protein